MTDSSSSLPRPATLRLRTAREVVVQALLVEVDDLDAAPVRAEPGGEVVAKPN